MTITPYQAQRLQRLRDRVISRQVKIGRIILDIEQQDLANAVKLSRQTISNIECGATVPHDLTVIKIKRYFSERGINFDMVTSLVACGVKFQETLEIGNMQDVRTMHEGS